MKRWMTALGTTLATMTAATMTAVGCAPLVLDPELQQQDSTSSTSTASGGGTSSGDPAPGTTVIAALFKDMPVGPGSSQASNPAVYLTDADPDALVLVWSKARSALVCRPGDRRHVQQRRCTVWQGDPLSPSRRTWCAAWAWSTSPIRGSWASPSSTFNESGRPWPPATAVAAAVAPSRRGRCEIVSTDSGSVTVNLLTGLQGSPGGTFNNVVHAPVTLQGMYTASRCEPAPAPHFLGGRTARGRHHRRQPPRRAPGVADDRRQSGPDGDLPVHRHDDADLRRPARGPRVQGRGADDHRHPCKALQVPGDAPALESTARDVDRDRGRTPERRNCTLQRRLGLHVRAPSPSPASTRAGSASRSTSR